ncbi:MAG TPA: PepSY-like domain-containing protein [Chitinophagaceae bacterium]|jgi:hypothetical protein
MKQIIPIAILLIVVSATNVNAQDNTVAFNSQDFKNGYSYDNSNSAAANAATVNMRALRDFARSFKNAKNEKWYVAEDGFFANFTDNGVDTKVAYDKKGVWHCTIHTLNEDQLPFNVRNVVKSRYYDFKILVAYEIEHNNSTTYILKIDDGKALKMLRVVDGEIEIITDNIKG